MTGDGRAGCTHDRKCCALILPATFAGPHGGEATRSDAVISTWTRTSGSGPRTRTDRPEKCSPGPPKSKPGQRIAGIPDAIIAAPREHLPVFVEDDYGAGPAGGRPALRRSAHRHQISPFHAPEAATAAIKIVVRNGGPASETQNPVVAAGVLARPVGADSQEGVTAALRVQPDSGEEFAEGGAGGLLGGKRCLRRRRAARS